MRTMRNLENIIIASIYYVLLTGMIFVVAAVIHMVMADPDPIWIFVFLISMLLLIVIILLFISAWEDCFTD